MNLNRVFLFKTKFRKVWFLPLVTIGAYWYCCLSLRPSVHPPVRPEQRYHSNSLTHWGRVTHICVGKLTIIGSDDDLSPERRQAIIWTNAGILLIRPLGTNFSEILMEIQTFSLKKIRMKMSSVKCCSFLLGLNVLRISTISLKW